MELAIKDSELIGGLYIEERKYCIYVSTSLRDIWDYCANYF